MDTRRYLGQISWYERRILNKAREIERLYALVTSFGINYDKENIQTSKVYDKMGDTVADIYDLMDEAKELVRDYTTKKRIIVRQIDSMDGMDYQVLEAKYVRDMSINDIAKDFGFTREYVSRNHSKALKNFKEKYGYAYENEN